MLSVGGMSPHLAASQALNFLLVLGTAYMMWKLLSVIADSPSPIVVVLSGSMEPAFRRGDLLFLWNRGKEATEVGEVVVYNVRGKDIPIVHRVVRRFGGGCVIASGCPEAGRRQQRRRRHGALRNWPIVPESSQGRDWQRGGLRSICGVWNNIAERVPVAEDGNDWAHGLDRGVAAGVAQVPARSQMDEQLPNTGTHDRRRTFAKVRNDQLGRTRGYGEAERHYSFPPAADPSVKRNKGNSRERSTLPSHLHSASCQQQLSSRREPSGRLRAPSTSRRGPCRPRRRRSWGCQRGPCHAARWQRTCRPRDHAWARWGLRLRHGGWWFGWWFGSCERKSASVSRGGVRVCKCRRGEGAVKRQQTQAAMRQAQTWPKRAEKEVSHTLEVMGATDAAKGRARRRQQRQWEERRVTKASATQKTRGGGRRRAVGFQWASEDAVVNVPGEYEDRMGTSRQQVSSERVESGRAGRPHAPGDCRPARGVRCAARSTRSTLLPRPRLRRARARCWAGHGHCDVRLNAPHQALRSEFIITLLPGPGWPLRAP
ncbi:hypothetical protein FH972_021656 [Carpinus fangiana]|uniref:Signal peptidase complex catalytic subunit SEC11 n=1 Tax=Carpinus fangiana TaxID=176857 RepID=A0A5N6KS29_9ROSI|nr:hypothetical protein FH972_021656 [Carpinus fangiana]